MRAKLNTGFAVSGACLSIDHVIASDLRPLDLPVLLYVTMLTHAREPE